MTSIPVTDAAANRLSETARRERRHRDMQQIYNSPFPRLAPRRLPPKRNPVKRLAIIAGVVVALIAVGALGLVIYTKVTPQHRLLIDNATETSVAVEIDGKTLHVGPRSSTSVAVGDGRLAIHATAPNLDERVTLDLPASGWNTPGATAVYNIGGRGDLAVVSMGYGTVFHAPPIQFLGHEQRAVLVPGVMGEIDEPFPAQIESRGTGTVLRHVCHVDGERFKCPGSNASDAP